MDWFTDPWNFEFMYRALVAGVIVSLAAGMVGVFVVLRGLAFMGDAVAHTQLAGAAVALVLGGGAVLITLGAGVAAVLTALGVALLTIRGRLREDTAIGIMFAGLFALGIVLISRQRTLNISLNDLLVGDILGASWTDLMVMAALTVVVALLVLSFLPELRFTAYDPEVASVSGVPVTLMQIGLLVLIALATVVAFRLVGVVLALAMLVTPAAAAALLTRRLTMMMLISTMVGVVSTVVGLYASFYYDLAAGPSIVLAAVLMMVLAFILSPRGLRSTVPSMDFLLDEGVGPAPTGWRRTARICWGACCVAGDASWGACCRVGDVCWGACCRVGERFSMRGRTG
ncbi:MAG: metal ABC transporter permease [Chloroflexi bacterium]|nr:metal ABC transporter permease [Chloroflexota bacterium]MYF23501.1 metal ABC transporter permease [Chloroflexota bacterium]